MNKTSLSTKLKVIGLAFVTGLLALTACSFPEKRDTSPTGPLDRNEAIRALTVAAMKNLFGLRISEYLVPTGDFRPAVNHTSIFFSSDLRTMAIDEGRIIVEPLDSNGSCSSGKLKLTPENSERKDINSLSLIKEDPRGNYYIGGLCFSRQ